MPTRWKQVLRFSFFWGKTSELKCFTSLLSRALHPAGCLWPWALSSLLTIASGQPSKYLKLLLGLNSTCYFSSESRLSVKGQDSRDMAGTAPLLPSSSKARISQMEQHACADLVRGWASDPSSTVTLVRSPMEPVRKFTHHPREQDMFPSDARLVEIMILEFSPYLMYIPDW